MFSRLFVSAIVIGSFSNPELNGRRFNLSLPLATYPANLCPFLGRGEFAKGSSDFGEPIDKSVEEAERVVGFK